VQYEPNSTFSLKEREEQQKVVEDLFNQIQDLAYLVYNIDQLDEKIEALVKLDNQNKNLNQFNLKLDSLRNKLVVTTGDNYVGAAEPQLKEKFNDIYGTINSYPGAPSSTQLENIAALKKDLQKASQELDKLKAENTKTFEQALEKNNIQKPAILSFDEFLKS
jgi:hypothetical protein